MLKLVGLEVLVAVCPGCLFTTLSFYLLIVKHLKTKYQKKRIRQLFDQNKNLQTKRRRRCDACSYLQSPTTNGNIVKSLYGGLS